MHELLYYYYYLSHNGVRHKVATFYFFGIGESLQDVLVAILKQTTFANIRTNEQHL